MDSEAISILVSIAALVVSMLSGVGAYRVQRAQTRIQERLLALEAARERSRLREIRRARLTARVVRQGTDYRLVIANEGSGPARRVRTHLDGQPLSQHPLVPQVQGEVSELGAGAQAEYLLAVTYGTPDVVTVEIAWDDDSSEPGTWSSQLRV